MWTRSLNGTRKKNIKARLLIEISQEKIETSRASMFTQVYMYRRGREGQSAPLSYSLKRPFIDGGRGELEGGRGGRVRDQYSILCL